MADMDRLPEQSGRHGLVLLEDCAHAPGARWRDRAAGTFGDFGFYFQIFDENLEVSLEPTASEG